MLLEKISRRVTYLSRWNTPKSPTNALNEHWPPLNHHSTTSFQGFLLPPHAYITRINPANYQFLSRTPSHRPISRQLTIYIYTSLSLRNKRSENVVRTCRRCRRRRRNRFTIAWRKWPGPGNAITIIRGGLPGCNDDNENEVTPGVSSL